MNQQFEYFKEMKIEMNFFEFEYFRFSETTAELKTAHLVVFASIQQVKINGRFHICRIPLRRNDLCLKEETNQNKNPKPQTTNKQTKQINKQNQKKRKEKKIQAKHHIQKKQKKRKIKNQSQQKTQR